jgi:CheY-like chemotaxis protein
MGLGGRSCRNSREERAFQRGTPVVYSPAVRARVLVADDQADVLEALRFLLKGADLEADFVTSPAAALGRLQAQPYELLLADLNYTRDTTSAGEGLDLVSRARGLDPHLPVVVMTGWGTIDTAVEAMRRPSSGDCCRRRCRASPRTGSRPRGGRPAATAATATTRSRSTRTCSDCSLPTWQARVSRRRCSCRTCRRPFARSPKAPLRRPRCAPR